MMGYDEAADIYPPLLGAPIQTPPLPSDEWEKVRKVSRATAFTAMEPFNDTKLRVIDDDPFELNADLI